MSKSMQTAAYWLFLALPVVSPCPFAKNDAVAPNDEHHHLSLCRHHLTALSDNPKMKETLNAIINNDRTGARSLQATCLSETTYDAIGTDIVAISEFPDNISRAQ